MHAATTASEWCGPRGRSPLGITTTTAVPAVGRAHRDDERPRRAVRRSAPVQGDVLRPAARGFGHGGPGGHRGGGRGGRGGRARRGDVRAALLLLLESQPQNGYQLIQEIERRTEGVWKPSPGSVYPALQQLEDEGLVRAAETEGKRAYDLTPEGREYIEGNRAELGDPFEAATGGMDEGFMDLRGLMFQVGAAAMQVAAAGHVDEARKILGDTRRALYKILAEDDPGDAARRGNPRHPATGAPRRGRPRHPRGSPLRVMRRCWFMTKSRTALDEGRPVVALESTIIAHGLPRPDNLRVAREIEAVVREHGRGAGDDRDPRRRGADRARRRGAGGAGEHATASPSAACATSRRSSLAGGDGATTVAATSHLAERAGHPRVRHRRARRRPSRRARHLRRVGRPRDAGARRDLRRLRGREVDPRHPRDARAPGDAERHRARLPHRHASRLLPRPTPGCRCRGGSTRRRRPPRCCASATALGAPGAVVVANPLDEQLDPELHDRVLREGLAGRRGAGHRRPRRDPVPARALPHAHRRREPARERPARAAQRRAGRGDRRAL